MGLSRADVMDMPWGQLVLMLQAKAQSYEDGPKESTPEQVFSFFAAK
jgi:hypothetical protein